MTNFRNTDANLELLKDAWRRIPRKRLNPSTASSGVILKGEFGGPFLEVYSFAHNTLFLHILKYGIPGSVATSEEKSCKIVNIILSEIKCTPHNWGCLFFALLEK